MLLPDKNTSLQYFYTSGKEEEVYGFGNYLHKITQYMKDSEDRWKLESQIYNAQNTEWPSVEAYEKSLKRCETQISNHISINENPFIL